MWHWFGCELGKLRSCVIYFVWINIITHVSIFYYVLSILYLCSRHWILGVLHVSRYFALINILFSRPVVPLRHLFHAISLHWELVCSSNEKSPSFVPEFFASRITKLCDNGKLFMTKISFRPLLCWILWNLWSNSILLVPAILYGDSYRKLELVFGQNCLSGATTNMSNRNCFLTISISDLTSVKWDELR